MFTVFTRTSNRPQCFQRCRMSVLAQSEKAYHLISSDDPNDEYPQGDKIIRVAHLPGRGHNLYFNIMRHHAPPQSPWCVFLDDDDMFAHPNALKAVRAAIQSEDSLILWRVKIGSNIIPRRFGQTPVLGDVTGIGFCLHLKHWIDWPGTTAGDFAVIQEYYRKLDPVWIDEVLTQMQWKPGGGKRMDF